MVSDDAFFLYWQKEASLKLQNRFEERENSEDDSEKKVLRSEKKACALEKEGVQFISSEEQ